MTPDGATVVRSPECEVLTPIEVQDELGVDAAQLARLIASGALPVIRLSATRWVARAVHVDALLNGRRSA